MNFVTKLQNDQVCLCSIEVISVTRTPTYLPNFASHGRQHGAEA